MKCNAKETFAVIDGLLRVPDYRPLQPNENVKT
jgi:hypothetical protein